jgi:hypothetical protein
MTRGLRLAALIAPVLGLAGLWALSDQALRQGTEWDVPIQGYDPRDLLRGHYVEFSYDWPGITPGETAQYPALCLEGRAPRLARAAAAPEDPSCPYPVRADRSGIYGWDPLGRGRLYIGQARADALQRQLQDRDLRGIVTIRQRDDGSFTPVAIRFRPLTPAERAARDAPQNEAGGDRSPPAIMSR